MPHAFPSAPDALALHRRLLDPADPTASRDLLAAVLDPLEQWLARRSPRVDPHLIQSAAHDAVLDLVRKPEAFEPSKRGLVGFLRMAAARDLANHLAREGRHRLAPLPDEIVAPAGFDRNESEEAAAELVALAAAAGVADWPEPERRAFELYRGGERATAPLAAALGCADLAVGEQTRLVKRFKDRVNLRLRRRIAS